MAVKTNLRVSRSTEALSALQLGPIVTGAMAGITLSLCVAAVLSLLFYFTSLNEGILPPVVVGLGIVSIFFSGAIAGKQAGALGWVHGAIAGLLYVLVVYLVGVAIVAYPITFIAILEKLASGLGLGALGGVLGINL